MKHSLGLDIALGKLADKIEYGHLLASTDPVGFVEAIIERMEKMESLLRRWDALEIPDDFWSRGEQVFEDYELPLDTQQALALTPEKALAELENRV